MRAHLTFTHTDDPYTVVDVAALPREGEEFGIVNVDDVMGGEGPLRLDKVVRVRHYVMRDGDGWTHEAHVILDRA